MLNIKIQGGTPKAGKGLCHTCKKSTIVKGQNCEELITCTGPFANDFHRGRVRFKVAECADYHPVNMPWLHEMEEMAWRIEAKKRGPKGFEPENSEMEVVVIAPKNGRSGTLEE